MLDDRAKLLMKALVERYIADGQITAAEILEQEARITQMLRDLEHTLNDEQHEQLTKVLLEYEVLVTEQIQQTHVD